MLLKINLEIYLFICCALDKEFFRKKAESVMLQAVLFISWKKRKKKKKRERKKDKKYFKKGVKGTQKLRILLYTG